MINVICPKCQKVVSVEDYQTGQPVPCPNCGNVNIAPAPSPESTTPPDAPACPPEIPPAVPPAEQKDWKMWGMFCHLSAFAGFLGIPFGNIIGPLIVWLVKRNEIPFVDQEGKESLNFQISMTIYALVAGVLVFVLVGFFLLLAIMIVSIVCVIQAAMKANTGEGNYTYPLTIRFIK